MKTSSILWKFHCILLFYTFFFVWYIIEVLLCVFHFILNMYWMRIKNVYVCMWTIVWNPCQCWFHRFILKCKRIEQISVAMLMNFVAISINIYCNFVRLFWICLCNLLFVWRSFGKNNKYWNDNKGVYAIRKPYWSNYIFFLFISIG